MKKEKKLIFVFGVGFFIGVFLEIFFFEIWKVGFIPKPEASGKIPRVTCLVLLKHNHLRYVSSSKKTWLTHCDDYYVVKIQKPKKRDNQTITTSSSNAEEFLLFLSENKTCSKKDGRFRNGEEIEGKSAWSGLCKALHITKRSDSEWLLLVPDSLLVLLENAKLFVSHLDSDAFHYYGHAVRHYEADYNLLSAGILMSRGALTRLLEEFPAEECDLRGKYWRNEDLFLGKYLKQLGILPKDTRDEKGRGRFHGYNMNNILWPGKLFLRSDYNKKALYPAPQGFNCCSPSMITVDASDPDAMLNLYYFFYKLTTSHKHVPKPVEVKKAEGFSWKEFLKSDGYNNSVIEKITAQEYYKIWEKKLPLDYVEKEMKTFLENHKRDME